MKLYDFAKYHVCPPFSINADGFIFSKAAFDKLPKELQQTLTATLEERAFLPAADGRARAGPKYRTCYRVLPSETTLAD